MKVVDLHPDDLLDKDARGELTPTERTRLEAHLSRCATCRFEREVRADFKGEVEDEMRLSPQQLIALMEGLPQAPPQSGPRDEESANDRRSIPALSSRPERFRKKTRIALLIAAALFVGSMATASVGAKVWAHVAATFTDRAPSTAAPATVPAVTASTAARQTRGLANADPPDEHRSTDEVIQSTAVPPSASPPPPAPPPRAPVVTAQKKAPVTAEPVESAGTMFDAANEARRQGDYARAIFLHRRLQLTHPTSREAHVSYGTVGQLLLDRGDAVGALASFDSYQARGAGPLDEAVLVGRAKAFERLGRTDQARASWAALLRAFPDTPYADHARARISSLR